MPVRVCFVCLGNICRSPTAEAVMRARVREAGLEDEILIESAGTGAWHAGHPPDARASAEAAARGVRMEGRARQFEPEDFARFDLILAMDERNLGDLRAIAPDAAARARVRMLRDFDPARPDDRSVPDPYYGGPDGFTEVFDMVDAACTGLLDHLQAGPPAAR
ncbi:MAG: low molecular weight protein-tyrosine-phosphatase [Thermoleophilia bacterium]